MAVIFTSHKDEVLSALKAQVRNGLDQIGSAAEHHAKDITPVRTGKLRDSIWHRPIGDQAEGVGTDTVEYAIFVELGTSKMHAQPYLRPAAENYGSEYVEIMQNALNG